MAFSFSCIGRAARAQGYRLCKVNVALWKREPDSGCQRELPKAEDFSLHPSCTQFVVKPRSP
eukprot:4754543-Amphidinium_carterae.1